MVYNIHFDNFKNNYNIEILFNQNMENKDNYEDIIISLIKSELNISIEDTSSVIITRIKKGWINCSYKVDIKLTGREIVKIPNKYNDYDLNIHNKNNDHNNYVNCKETNTIDISAINFLCASELQENSYYYITLLFKLLTDFFDNKSRDRENEVLQYINSMQIKSSKRNINGNGNGNKNTNNTNDIMITRQVPQIFSTDKYTYRIEEYYYHNSSLLMKDFLDNMLIQNKVLEFYSLINTIQIGYLPNFILNPSPLIEKYSKYKNESIDKLKKLIPIVKEKNNIDYVDKFSYLINTLENPLLNNDLDAIFNNNKNIKVLTHYDVHQDNVLVNTFNSECKFIDFEHVCTASLGVDLTTTLLFLGCLFKFDFNELISGVDEYNFDDNLNNTDFNQLTISQVNEYFISTNINNNNNNNDHNGNINFNNSNKNIEVAANKSFNITRNKYFNIYLKMIYVFINKLKSESHDNKYNINTTNNSHISNNDNLINNRKLISQQLEVIENNTLKDWKNCYYYNIIETCATSIAYQARFFNEEADYNYVTTRYDWAKLMNSLLEKIEKK